MVASWPRKLGAGMLLERGARKLVRSVGGGDLGEHHAAQLGGEPWTRPGRSSSGQALRGFGVLPSFHENRPAGKEAVGI